MKIISANNKRYLLKRSIPMKRLSNIDDLDDETTKLLKEYLDSDTIIKQKSKQLYLFCEQIGDAIIIEETENK